MADWERRLLAVMTTTEGISEVVDARLNADVFEDPINRAVFEWMIEYWQGSAMQMAPTWVVMEHEFPSVKLVPEKEDEEVSTEWLIGALQDRHVINQGQDMLMAAGRTLSSDPVGSLRALAERARAIVDDAGRVGGGTYAEEFLNVDQLDDLKPPEPLIAEVLSRHCYCILRGRDRTFKSFVALDWSLCLATNTPWQGKPTERVKVLYVAGEGAHGIGQRVRAWKAAHDATVDPEWFVVRRSAVNLFRPGAEFDHLLAYIKDGEFGLVVFDTLRRMSGGAEGNGSDMGVVVDNIDRVKRATEDGTVLVLAHTDKGDNDTRGFSGIEDDADIVWSATRENNTNEVTIRCEKFKDGPDGHRFDLRARSHDDSLVIAVATHSRGELFTEANTTDQRVMATMRDVLAADGATVQDLVTMTGLSQSSVYRSRARLQARGLLRSDGSRRLFLCGGEEVGDAEDPR